MIIRYLSARFLAICALSVSAFVEAESNIGSALADNDVYQTGRYTYVNNVPTGAQLDIFSADIQVAFSEEVLTIGEAVETVLLQTGYAVASSFASDPYQDIVLARRLPEGHRKIGPLPLYKALELLVGDEFILVTDDVHALVAFDLRPSELSKYGPRETIARNTPFNNQSVARRRTTWTIDRGSQFASSIDGWATAIEWKSYWPDGKPPSVLATTYSVDGDFYAAVNTALSHLKLHGIKYRPEFYEDSKTLIINQDYTENHNE